PFHSRRPTCAPAARRIEQTLHCPHRHAKQASDSNCWNVAALGRRIGGVTAQAEISLAGFRHGYCEWCLVVHLGAPWRFETVHTVIKPLDGNAQDTYCASALRNKDSAMMAKRKRAPGGGRKRLGPLVAQNLTIRIDDDLRAQLEASAAKRAERKQRQG